MIQFFWFNSVGCESNISWVLLADFQIYMHLQVLLLKLLILLSSMKFSENHLLSLSFDLPVSILIQCSCLSLIITSHLSISCISILSIAESVCSKINKNHSVFSDIQYWSAISKWTMFFVCLTTGLHSNKCFSLSRKTKNCFSVLFLWPLISPLAIVNKTQLLSASTPRKDVTFLHTFPFTSDHLLNSNHQVWSPLRALF